MQDKRFFIQEVEYFKDYRDNLVYGLTVHEILETKLVSLGYYYDDQGFGIPEDLFYCSEDFIEKFISKKGKVDYVKIDSSLNYYDACEHIRMEINVAHMENQVKIMSVASTYIDYSVKIAPGAVIYPNTYLEGESYIQENTLIGPESIIRDSWIGPNSVVLKSVVEESKIGQECTIGPFTYIRPGTDLSKQVKVGTFVELKNAKVEEGTKIPHLSYVGDAIVGKNSNISAGVITANYDGKNKHTTKVGDHVFVGCNSTLIAPVELESNVYVAAGSQIVEDVKSGSLAIARSYQVNKEGWVEKTGRKK